MTGQNWLVLGALAGIIAGVFLMSWLQRELEDDQFVAIGLFLTVLLIVMTPMAIRIWQAGG